MHISVILATYNQPHLLERVLWGYAVQTDPDFELVVADDGSGAETAALIQRMRVATELNIVPVWHENAGFRKTVILNRAIEQSIGDYLLFSDGDCIPRRDMIQVHRGLAEPGRYLAGGYLKLSAGVSEQITVQDVKSGRVTDLAWLRAHGWRPGRRALRLARSRGVARLLDRITPTRAEFQGNNASAWREAIYAVNGFDNEMGYGGLDRALGFRLANMGVKGKQIRHRAVCMHLHHARPYRRAEVLRGNDAILNRIRRGGETRASRGIAELPWDPSVRIDGQPAPRA